MDNGNFDEVNEHGRIEGNSCQHLKPARYDGGIGFRVGSGWYYCAGTGLVVIDTVFCTLGGRIVICPEKARALAQLLLAAAHDVEHGIEVMNEGEDR